MKSSQTRLWGEESQVLKSAATYISGPCVNPLVTDDEIHRPKGFPVGVDPQLGFKLMKHFSIWQWADFVRGLGEDAARSEMDAHLASRCSRCQRIVHLLRRVAVAAHGEAGYEPPEHAIQFAKAVYLLSSPEKISFPRLVARLVYDSLREPLPAGMRGLDRPSRHAMYEAGSYCLDLQIEQQHASGPVTLIGQLADRDNPMTSTPEVPVWVMERNSLVASALCNRFGEFQLEYAPRLHLRLHVPIRAAGKRLEVSLDRLTPKPATRRRGSAKILPQAD